MASGLDPNRAAVRRILAERALDMALAARRAERPARQDRARKGAATRVHLAYERDRLRNEVVPL